jgi:anionic cell wall polymer biosynthesis LytR-Cps2A-Psr (LCP) family protein
MNVKPSRPARTEKTRAGARTTLITALLGVTVLASACGTSEAAQPTITPIVITIDVSSTPTAAPSPTTVVVPRPTLTEAPTPTAVPTNTPLPTATPEPTATPQPTAPAIAGRNVLLPQVPISASTGITSTDAFSLNVVPPPVAPVRLPPGTINIALLGIDTRPRLSREDIRPGVGGANSDVIIIASIQPDIPAVTMLSIPRDTLAYIPNVRLAKINTAFARGGPELLKQTIKYNLGLNVDYFVAVNFAAVVNAVNTLGGIDVVASCQLYQVFPKDPYYLADNTTPLTVTVPYTDSFTGEVWQPGQAVPTQTIWIPRPGVYTLNGLQTLAYARARYGVPGGDIDRGRRTQQVVRAMLSKARSNGLATFAQLPALIDQYGRSVQTDLSLDQILALASLANALDDGLVRSRYFDGVGLTGGNFPEVGSVLIPNRENVSGYLQQAMNVALNQQAGAGVPIEFVNATGNPDMDVVAAGRLRELGFDVVAVQDASEVVSRTRVIDFTTTTKGNALPRLQSAFEIKPEAISNEPNPEGPRYRLIAGRDFDPCYARNYAFTRGSVAAPTPAPAPTLDPNATPVAPVDPNAPAPTPDPNAQPTPDPNAPALPTIDPNTLPTPTPEG